MKCLEKVRAALLSVSDNVGHYEALRQEDAYIVWAESSGKNNICADNYVQAQALEGTIDYYTRSEGDPAVLEIQEALKKARISFYLHSVQYEDPTKYIHYEWVFEVA